LAYYTRTSKYQTLLVIARRHTTPERANMAPVIPCNLSAMVNIKLSET